MLENTNYHLQADHLCSHIVCFMKIEKKQEQNFAWLDLKSILPQMPCDILQSSKSGCMAMEKTEIKKTMSDLFE